MPDDNSAELKHTKVEKLLIIGVDAGSPALFKQWAADGAMPNLKALMDSGRWGRVKNPYALEAGAVWPVFNSGLLPGNQPQYDARRTFDSRDYSVRLYEHSETPPTFWRQLSDQGLECLIVDPPYVYLDPEINGSMVVDWGGHVPAANSKFCFKTTPPQLAQEIATDIGLDPAEGIPCDARSPKTLAELQQFHRIYRKRIAMKGRLATKLLAESSWQLALVVTSDLHCTGHHLWHINDPSHPSYSKALESTLGEPLKQCYRDFDRTLGDIMANVDDDTTVLVYGSHGMGPQYTGTGLLDHILLRLDEDNTASRRMLLKDHLRLGWQRLPLPLRTAFKPVRKLTKGVLPHGRFLGNERNRRFFEVYANNASSGIRVNLKGREAEGKVDPADFQALAQYLQTSLKAIINCETGEPLVDDVVITHEHYDGPYLQKLPDMLVVWNRNAPIRRVQSDAIGTIANKTADNRTGDHTAEGMYILAGAGIAATGESGTVAAADFAPSVAEFFDLYLSETDGKSFGIPTRDVRAA